MFPPIAFQRDGDIWVVNPDGSGESNVTRSPRAEDANPDWSSAGTSEWSVGPWLAFQSDRDGRPEVWVMRLRYNPANPARPYEGDAASMRKITDGPGGASLNPSWFVFTPDREASGPRIDSIAFDGPDEDGGESDIHYAEHDRGAVPFPAGDRILTFTLTSGPGDDRAPAWSPTGDRIAYQSKRGGHSDIYVMDPFADSETDLNLTQFVGDNANPDWEAPYERSDETFPIQPRGRRSRPRSRRGRVFGGEPPPRLRRQGSKCRKTGTPRNDLLCGTPRRDVLRGKGGDDRILGRGGNDRLLGGAGNDRILGDSGRDEIRGGAGADRLNGGSGRDNIGGGGGRDRIEARDGQRDRVSGGPGRDLLIVDKRLDRRRQR